MLDKINYALFAIIAWTCWIAAVMAIVVSAYQLAILLTILGFLIIFADSKYLQFARTRKDNEEKKDE